MINRPLLSLFWMTMSGLSFSLMSLSVKLIGNVYDPREIVFFRAVVNFVFVLVLMLIRKETLNPLGKPLLFFRGLMGFFAVTCFFYALTALPLSISSMLNWCSPLFVFVISAFFLKEHHSPKLFVWVVLAFVGLYLLLNPDFAHESHPLPILAIAIGLLGTIFSSLAYVAVRAATKSVGVNGIVLYFTGTATLLSIPLTWGHFQIPSSLKDWSLLIGMGLFATGGQLTMTRAYGYSAAGLVSTFSLLGAAFSSVWGFLILGESLAALQWIGMGLLTISISFVAWRSAGTSVKLKVR